MRSYSKRVQDLLPGKVIHLLRLGWYVVDGVSVGPERTTLNLVAHRGVRGDLSIVSTAPRKMTRRFGNSKRVELL